MPLSIKGEELWFTPQSTPPCSLLLVPCSRLSSQKITIQTSGSTGKPKTIRVEKEKMVFSARQTCSFLGLKKGDTAYLCMDLRYIGAKMMVVRALTWGMHLIIREASGHPLRDMDAAIDFAAMVPLQVYNSLQVTEERERLSKIKHLIIGGGAIDPAMEKELQSFPNNIYSTYGMTETLSHIALRRISGEGASRYYTPFPSVKLSLSADNTLIIDAPGLCDTPLTTNDIVELLPDGRFRIIGRKDNTINTGGVKVQAETVEEKLSAAIPTPFAITSVPHPKFGEAVVLLIPKEADMASLQTQIKLLPKYEQPKYIFQTAIPLTPNGKINRPACRELARGFL